MRPNLAVALAALAAGGCAVGPQFHRPQPPERAGYAVSLPERTAAAGGVSQQFGEGADVPFKWWEAFGSPALSALVERVLRANPTVSAAQATLREAQEMVYAQQGYFFPSVGADYTFERQKLAGNLSGSNAPGVQGNGTRIDAYQNSSPLAPLHNAPLYYNFHTAELTVGFVPDVFGANRRKVESLDAQAQIARFELEATYVSLASNVVAAAIEEASIRTQLEATRDIIDRNEKSAAILRDKLGQGYASRADLAAQELQLEEARALLPPLERQFEQNRDLIRALAGNLPNGEIKETFDLESLTVPADLPLSVPSKLIEQRPDIRAAEAALHSANADVGVAVAAMLPQFSITGAYGGTATQFSQMFRSGGPFWNLVGNATQPLFAGGTLLHTKRAADQALRAAAAQYQSTVQQAYENVADTLHAIVTDADALDAAARAKEAAKVAFDQAHLKAEGGYGDRLAELAAGMAYSQSVLGEAQARAMRLGDTAALYQALGGGWWNREKAAARSGGAAAAGTERGT